MVREARKVHHQALLAFEFCKFRLAHVQRAQVKRVGRVRDLKPNAAARGGGPPRSRSRRGALTSLRQCVAATGAWPDGGWHATADNHAATAPSQAAPLRRRAAGRQTRRRTWCHEQPAGKSTGARLPGQALPVPGATQRLRSLADGLTL